MSSIESKYETLQRLYNELKAENRFLKTTLIENELRQAAKAAGVKSVAVEDSLLYARDFEFESGLVRHKTGLDALSWLRAQRTARAHWFEPNSDDKAALPAENPFTSRSWNKTKQAILWRDNPSLAEKLAKEAGVTVDAVRPAA